MIAKEAPAIAPLFQQKFMRLSFEKIIGSQAQTNQIITAAVSTSSFDET
jgi:hypothetical protein